MVLTSKFAIKFKLKHINKKSCWSRQNHLRILNCILNYLYNHVILHSLALITKN